MLKPTKKNDISTKINENKEENKGHYIANDGYRV